MTRSEAYHNSDSYGQGSFPFPPSLDELGDKGSRLSRILRELNPEQYRPQLERAVERYLTDDAQAKIEKKLKAQPALFDQDAPERSVNSVHLYHRTSRAGRPPVDVVRMFRTVFLGRILNIGDKALSGEIASNVIYAAFVGVPQLTHIPHQTIWRYRQIFTRSKLLELIAQKHIMALDQEGLVQHESRIVDASFVEALKQRNTREENARIKAGRGEPLWKNFPKKKCQKDIEAAWTKKRDKTHYGYKIHALVDANSKLMIHCNTTPANVHDSQALGDLLSEEDAGMTLYADSAYVGKSLDELIKSYGMTPKVGQKGYRNKPLTEDLQAVNRAYSKVRCRIEHVFGFIKTALNGSSVRTIGKARAESCQWLTMLCYNVFRAVQLRKQMAQLS